MQNIIKNSFIYKVLAAIYAWFGVQWGKSRIVSRFLSQDRCRPASESSLFSKIFSFIHRLFCFIFEKLRLNKLLKGSIFKNPYIWCFLTAVLAPILPTMPTLALALVSFGSLFLKFCCDRSQTLTYSPVNKYILLFIFVYAISIVTSVDRRGSLNGGLITIVFILFSVVLQNAISTKRQLNWFIYAIVLSGTAVALYGCYQYVFGISSTASWIDADMFSELSVRVFSTLQNPNVLSEYLLLIIPIGFACVLCVDGAGKKFLMALCVAVMVVCMVLTLSRGGWLGLIFAIAIFLVLLDRRFILVGILGLVLLYFVLPDAIIERFTSIGDLSDTSTSYRVSIWIGTLAMLKDYWFCGIGPGTAAFNTIYPTYSLSAAYAEHSHNLFLQITCDSGIAGIVIFVIMVLSHIRMMCRAIKNEPDRKGKIFQIAILSSLSGFLVQSMTDYSFYNYRVMLMFWAIIGLGAVVARYSKLLGVPAND